MPQLLQFTLLSKHISLHMSLDHWVRTAPLLLHADFFPINIHLVLHIIMRFPIHDTTNHVSKTLILIMDAEG